MLNRLKPETRLLLTSSRTMAMQGRLTSAIKKLSEQTNAVIEDQAAIDLLQAELYYLNAQGLDAVKIFDTKLMPVLEKLPTDLKVIVLHNKNTASFGTLTSFSASDVYYLSDYRKLSGLNLWNDNELLIAQEAAKKGQHYEALPIYWQNLLYTYNQGIWNAHAAACGDMSKEFIALNWLPKASYYAIMSQDVKLAGTICDSLIRAKNANFVEQTLDTILTKAQLLKHASVACKIIAGIQDEIPDTYIEKTLSYLLNISSHESLSCLEIHPITNAWEAITSIAHRLSSKNACELMDAVIKHKWFNSAGANRRYLVGVLSNLVKALPADKLLDLSKNVSALAKEKKSDFDYVEVINFLLHLAFKGGVEVKKYLGDQLYGKNENINSILRQVAKNFDKEIQINNLDETVRTVSENILLQVQCLKADEEPKKGFDAYGTITKIDKDNKEKIVVAMSANFNLDALIKNKHLLKSDHIDLLITASITMVKEPDNLLSNKIGLINAIIELADKLTEKQSHNIFQVLEPLASGIVIEGSVGMSHAEASNPLNPYKMADTKPEVVSGAALYALACIESTYPVIFKDKLDELIRKALSDKNPIIREHACLAIREISTVNNELLASILYATRDPVYKTAIAAFDVILHRKDFDTSFTYQHLLFLSLYQAAHSEHKKLRCRAAMILKNLFNNSPSEYKDKIQELIGTLKSDICYSVRNALSES